MFLLCDQLLSQIVFFLLLWGKFLSIAFGIQINNGEHSERGDKRRNYRH
jgi:hypothetical protein